MNIRWHDIRYGIGLLAVTLALIFVWPGLLENLFVATGFIPHGHCYLWKLPLVGLHLTSDLLIGCSYVGISATLAYLVHKSRQDIPFHWMFLLFGTFITACGSTHFMEVWTLWTPVYWMSGELKLMTAVASVTTAVVLPSLVPQVLALVEAAKISEQRKQKLETANKELEELASKLKELDQLKTQFFAKVSHELRTPLTLILGPAEKLLASNELTLEQSYQLQVVRRNAQTLLKHVNDLLDVSKLEAGRMSVKYGETDLAKLVLLSAAHFESLAEDRLITFSIQTPPSLPAQVDTEKVQRICFNLLSNAFKFTPKSGTIKCILNVGNEKEKELTAILTVEDSGPGVLPEFRKIIFEPFRQGEDLKSSFESTGLGLAIVKEFVELHGGNVTVGNSSLGGAKFTVEIPLIAPAGRLVNNRMDEFPEKIDRELADQMLAGFQINNLPRVNNQSQIISSSESELLPTSIREAFSPAIDCREEIACGCLAPLILVVEDNPEMNQFIAEALGSEYCVISAFNGQEGLEQAIRLRPDLIISDVMMPEMSGDRMVREIRQHPELDGVPIVLLTAKADDDLRVQLLREGVQDYLMKPFSIEELKARAGNQIATKRAKEILQQELASQSQDLAVLATEVTLRQREIQTTLTALRESEERFRQLAENIDEVFWVADPKNSQMLYISPGYEKVWGRTCESLYAQPRSFLNAVAPEYLELVLATLERQKAGENTALEYRILLPDESTRWIYDRAFPVKNDAGEVVRVVGIGEDITARKQVEAGLQKFASELELRVADRTEQLAETLARLQQEQEALRVSEQRFRSYFELPLIGIAITSIEKNWLQVNDKLCQIFGYSREELSQLSWADITYPEDLARDVEQFNRLLTGEAESYSLDKRFIRKDGEVIHATIAAQCVRRKDGSIDYCVALVEDITERVKAIEKLRLLESVVVNANDAVVITEAEPVNQPGPKIIYVNDAFTRMSGYTAEEVLGKTPRILQGPNSDRVTLNKIRTALQNWQPTVSELINYRKDGSEFWVEISIVPVADSTGWYTHWIAIERDITERKQAEEAIYRRQQEFKTLVENAPDLILRCDRQMRYIYVNPIVERVSGIPLADYIGKNIREMGSPEELCQFWETTLNQVIETGKEQTIEFQSPTVEGMRSFQSRVVPELSKEGEIEAVLVVIRDITQLKQAEEERAQLIREQAARTYAEAQQQRLAFLAEASMMLASSLDYEATLAQLARLVVPFLADWCIVYIVKEDGSINRLAVAHANPMKEEILLQVQRIQGVEPNLPHPVWEVLRTGKAVIYPEFPATLIREAAQSAEHLKMLEALNPQSGLVVPLAIQGRTLGALGFGFADSGRRYGQEELTLAEDLASRAALAVDNARTHREAQEANRLKDDFLAVLSHELRTPLNAILGWATLLRQKKVDSVMAERALETIERNARAQTQMISDLLDVSRITRGKLQLNIGRVDLVAVLTAALDTLRPAAEAKGIELRLDLNPVGRVAGDIDRLQQVIWNLLSNAIKFTDAGGRVEVRLSVVNAEEGQFPRWSAQIEVSDTGKGINRKFLPYVFDRFRQENSSITRTHGGLGLGLSIVRHLVELHGGTVSADSPGEGQGATFQVKLPLWE